MVTTAEAMGVMLGGKLVCGDGINVFDKIAFGEGDVVVINFGTGVGVF